MLEKKYELRNPKAEDMFLMFRIISRIGIRNVKSCFEAEEVKAMVHGENGEEKDFTSIGLTVAFEIASVILEHLEAAKGDIYSFLSRLSGMKESEIAEMEMADFAELVIEVVKLEGFRDFFQRVIKSFK